jgi:hypothetical protein
MAGETIMSIAYGLDVLPRDDPYIKTAEQGVRPLMVAAIPGAFLVDLLPFLKYIPEWFPGAGFQRKAKAWKKLARDMIEVPFAAAKHNIVRHPPTILLVYVFLFLLNLNCIATSRRLVSRLLPLHQLLSKK